MSIEFLSTWYQIASFRKLIIYYSSVNDKVTNSHFLAYQSCLFFLIHLVRNVTFKKNKIIELV